jgi:hypothetical protein
MTTFRELVSWRLLVCFVTGITSGDYGDFAGSHSTIEMG